MNTTYSLSLTKRARSSLRSIYDYIRDVLSNETAAKKIVSKLLQGMESLKTFPEAGLMQIDVMVKESMTHLRHEHLSLNAMSYFIL
ncbi:MAG: type II toxin-antitoxin system RelE/ParE family toxin [Streptococcus sp.]